MVSETGDMEDSDGLTERLRQLESILLDIGSDRVMTPSELDGFLCGVAVAPEVIDPLEWLPYVLGEAQEAGVDDERLALLIDLAMERFNSILTELAMDAYRPLYNVDERHDQVLWEIWIEGFEQAMGLCRKAWEKLIKNGKNPEGQEAVGALLSLIALAEGGVDPDDPELKPLVEDVPNLIPALAGIFYRAHVAGPATPIVRDTHVGRNDPCPCGSGKKYKRCCGAA
jgi:uncharacterized protein